MSEYIPEGGPVGPAHTELREGKGLSAREVSKTSMIIAGVWIAAMTLLKAFWGFISARPFGLEMSEIIWSGIAIAAVWSPVYMSIFLEKVRDLKGLPK